MAFSYKTVIGSYETANDIPATGRVTFTPSAPMNNADIVVSAPVTAVLNASGDISVSLASTDDAGTQPTGVTYRVVEYIDGAAPRTYSINVPSAGGTIDLALVAPTVPGTPSATYALAGHTHSTTIVPPLDLPGATAGTDVLTTQVTTDTNKRLIVDADGTHSWGPGNATQDTNLYRGAANVLRTDDALVATKLTAGNATSQTDIVYAECDGTVKAVFAKATATGTATNPVIGGEAQGTGKRLLDLRVTGDAVSRLRVDMSAAGTPGTIVFGDGTTADTNLYRSAANTLKTDDSLVVAGNLTVDGIGGILFARRDSGQSVTSSTTLVNDNQLFVSVAANAVYTVELAMAVTAGGGGFKHSFTGPAGAAMPAWGDTTEARFASIGAVDAWPSATSSYITIDGLLTTAGTAGTFQVQWAQNSSNAAATQMLSGSFLKLTRVG